GVELRAFQPRTGREVLEDLHSLFVPHPPAHATRKNGQVPEGGADVDPSQQVHTLASGYI
ncbi:MAG TPA: hypothetical protein VGB40_05890, partial [Rubrobacteraceae bacterium]